jgi:hypothetical protein
MLTREDWTKGTGTIPVVRGLIWFADGSKLKEGTGAGIYGQSMGRRLSFSVGRYATFFQTEIYAILARVYEIQLHIECGTYRLFQNIAKELPVLAV